MAPVVPGRVQTRQVLQRPVSLRFDLGARRQPAAVAAGATATARRRAPERTTQQERRPCCGSAARRARSGAGRQGPSLLRRSEWVCSIEAAPGRLFWTAANRERLNRAAPALERLGARAGALSRPGDGRDGRTDGAASGCGGQGSRNQPSNSVN